MDFFDWPQLDDNYGRDETFASLNDFSIPQANDIASLAWTDYFPTPHQSLSQTPALTQRSGSSSSSSQDSFQCQDGGEDSQTEGPDNEDEIHQTSKATGRPRTPTRNGRDPVLNRIQRRRTQNRNSQRIYRQRRMEERQRFEERAIAAEEGSKQLRLHLTELNSVVSCLRYQVQQLEAENASLKARQ